MQARKSKLYDERRIRFKCGRVGRPKSNEVGVPDAARLGTHKMQKSSGRVGNGNCVSRGCPYSRNRIIMAYGDGEVRPGISICRSRAWRDLYCVG